jgi:hypothetical protein
MHLTREQLEHLVMAALPGERLREHNTLGTRRVLLRLASGEAYDLHLFADQTAASNAAQALRRLRGEIDLPIPMVHASDTTGELAGVPCLIASSLEGQPLADARPRLGEEQLHLIGQRLGDLAYRVHRLACSQYGRIANQADAPALTDEQAYVLARLATQLPAVIEANLLTSEQAKKLEDWFQQRFQPIGSGIALTIGSFAMHDILVRQSGSGWVLAGLLGWEHATGWCPAWDHTIFLDAARDSRYFALRIGYGKAYDDLTARTYEQVREGALRPYRMLLALEQLLAVRERSERERYRRMLLALLELQ